MPYVLQFIRAFGHSWGSLMSGVPSVPFAIAAIFVDNAYAKSIFALLAITCGVYASYAVWRAEHVARVALEEQLKPKLDWKWKDHDPHFHRVEVLDSKIISVIDLWNISHSHIDRIEIFCADAYQTQAGHTSLSLQRHATEPRRRLSNGDFTPIEIVAFNTISNEFECLLSYRKEPTERFNGSEFVMLINIVGVGITPGFEFVPSIKLRATFGLREGDFYISYEDVRMQSNPDTPISQSQGAS